VDGAAELGPVPHVADLAVGAGEAAVSERAHAPRDDAVEAA
jgi:hypothetical protein